MLTSPYAYPLGQLASWSHAFSGEEKAWGIAGMFGCVIIHRKTVTLRNTPEMFPRGTPQQTSYCVIIQPQDQEITSSALHFTLHSLYSEQPGRLAKYYRQMCLQLLRARESDVQRLCNPSNVARYTIASFFVRTFLVSAKSSPAKISSHSDIGVSKKNWPKGAGTIIYTDAWA